MQCCTTIEYGSFPSAPSSMSASSEASSGGGRSHRPHVRTVRLIRRGCPRTFGFSLRGGKEHGTGFFVSAVELGSEAYCQGLRVGDQIMRVNGFPLENAVHMEVLHLIQSLNHINLKVRTVGMIPIKEKRSDPLTWCLVVDEESSEPNILVTHSPKICHSDDAIKDVRILIEVAPKTKLGCGVCKGPDWKPGIFVQYTKEKGVAREAGLRPGDQILQCNGIPFIQAAFNHAVEVLKASGQLDLIVRKGAGFDLFPGESSGYNSLASSVNGDMSPTWGETKRLSIVREEPASVGVGDERLPQSDGHGFYLGNKWNQPVKYQLNGNGYGVDSKDGSDGEMGPGAPTTVIHIGESHGTSSSQDNTSSNNCTMGKIADICMISQQQETTTVTVEVHRSQAEENQTNLSQQATDHPHLMKSLSSTSLASASSCGSSLSSALSQELHRRTQRKDSDSTREQQRKTILKEMDKEKQEQHLKLMNEFKTAHRKMFQHTDGTETDASKVGETLAFRRDREPTLPRCQHVNNSVASDRHREEKENAVSVRKQEFPTAKQKVPKKNEGKGAAPPPPPMPPDVAGSSFDECGPPPACPTPDYDSSSISSGASFGNTLKHALPNTNNAKLISNGPIPQHASVAVENAKSSSKMNTSQSTKDSKAIAEEDRVEMISIESFALNNPSSPKPKPPATYFGAMVGSKKPKPVAVTIGEYPSNVDRRQPTRFDFLVSNSSEIGSGAAQVGRLFQSELVQTLSRSNLKKQTIDQENISKSSPNETVSAKGVVTISINRPEQSPSEANNPPRLSSHVKPSIKLAGDKIASAIANNRVMIQIPKSTEANSENSRSSECPGQPNGILKNMNSASVTNVNNCKHKSVIQQKSISFGEITMVISDLPQ